MEILHGDCRKRLQELIDSGVMVDAIVTDPPYELGFMNKGWDSTGIANDVEMWKLCLQVLKPGGYLLSFGGTRTYHRMTCAIEDAGFEIRDCVSWIYGTGFPKSLDVSKAIDKTAPSTDAAKQWSGFGTALKPSHEPIVLARKPLGEKTVAENVLRYGTGAINVDGCRVGLCEDDDPRLGGKGVWNRKAEMPKHTFSLPPITSGSHISGRFPANLIHDGSDEVEAEFAKQSKAMGMHSAGSTKKYSGRENTLSIFGIGGQSNSLERFGDTGSASRFFYCAKASRKERDLGCQHLASSPVYTEAGMVPDRDNRKQSFKNNNHPTVKPIALMKYLCRLITPPGGTVLDPFLGSGSTGVAALAEGFDFIGIEKESEYIEIAKARINGR